MMQISADKVKVCFVCQTVGGHCSGICFFFFKQYMQMLFAGISHPTQWASCQQITWCDALLCCSNRLCIWISFLWLTQSQTCEISCIKSKQRGPCLITWRSLQSTFLIPATDRGLVTVRIITLFSGSPKNKKLRHYLLAHVHTSSAIWMLMLNKRSSEPNSEKIKPVK